MVQHETILDFDKSLTNTNYHADTTFVMYKRRWIGLLSIWLLNIASGLVWLTFNAVPQISSQWLHATPTQVNLSVILYFTGSVVASTFSGFIFEKFGIKKALMLGGVINLVGTWIRYIAVFIESTEESHDGRLAVTLIGQFIAATAQPFILNASPKYASVWFSDSSRNIATSIGSLSSPVAAAVAMIIVPAVCKDENGNDMPLTLVVVGVFAIVGFLSTLIVSNSPPTPPSTSASLALAEDSTEPFWLSIKKTSTNKNFCILLFSFTVYCGFFSTFSSIINQIVGPYGYTDEEAGIFGMAFILAGVPGSIAAGIYLDKTKRYRAVLYICGPLLTFSYTALVFVVREDFFIGIAIVCACLGFASFSLLPAALESGVECTYPIPSSSSTSTLWMFGQFSTIIFLLAADALRLDDGEPPGNMRTVLIAAAAISVLTTAVSFLYNSPNYRLEAERSATKKFTTIEPK